MKQSWFLVISAILALFFGIGLLAAPETMLSNFGLTADETGLVLSRDLGITLLGLAYLNWTVRNEQTSRTLKAVLGANLIVQGGETVANLYSLSNGVLNSSAWVGIIMHLLLGLGFAYFLFFKPTK